MGNTIVTGVRRVFDRSHIEIQSISAKIEREQINGTHEKHEIYMDTMSNYGLSKDDNNFNGIKSSQVR